MNVNIYLKRDYEEFVGFGRRKNKANSKPNKANYCFTAENAEFAEQTVDWLIRD
jgi:hypothetical protein